jgi:threonine/homoserine/homoserine lactone efflux protein
MPVALPDPDAISVFAVAGLLLLITPGPAVLYIVARSVEQGRLAGIVSVCGITAGTLIHVTAAVIGLSALLASSALAFAIVKYVGAAYLVYLGLRRLFGRRELPPGEPHLPRRSLGRLFADGFIVNVLNPKTALFFLAFLPQFADPGRGPLWSQIGFLGLLFALMGLVSDGVYALIAGTAGGWMKRSRGFLKAERYVTAGIFVGLGVSAAVSGDARK